MNGKFMLDSLKASAITIPLAFILLLVLNFVSYQNPDPDKLLDIFAYAALFISMLICGALSEKLNGGNGLLCGLAAGLILIAVMLIVSAFMNVGGEGYNGLRAMLIYAGAAAVSAFGGYVCERILHGSRKTSSAKIRKNIRDKYMKR